MLRVSAVTFFYARGWSTEGGEVGLSLESKIELARLMLHSTAVAARSYFKTGEDGQPLPEEVEKWFKKTCDAVIARGIIDLTDEPDEPVIIDLTVDVPEVDEPGFSTQSSLSPRAR